MRYYQMENDAFRRKPLPTAYRSSYKKFLVSVTAGMLIVGLLQAVTGSTSDAKAKDGGQSASVE